MAMGWIRFLGWLIAIHPWPPHPGRGTTAALPREPTGQEAERAPAGQSFPEGRCSRFESFYSLQSKNIQAGKGLLSTLSRKCWSLQIPRRISHVEGHHNALPQRTLLPAANPRRTVTPLVILPSSPHLGKTCCLTIDLQFNPMFPNHLF